MNILVTARNTQTPVDRVRCSTNIFSGRTGAQVAVTAFDRGHTVTLLTLHPEVLAALPAARERIAPGWRVRAYRTFDDLESLMAAEITSGGFDVVIHAAAVSDLPRRGCLHAPQRAVRGRERGQGERLTPETVAQTHAGAEAR